MATRLAATLSLLSFAACLVAGAFVADNPLTTAVMRALYAMTGTFVVGLIAGSMAQRMLRENMDREAERLAEERQKRLEEAMAKAAAKGTGETLTVG